MPRNEQPKSTLRSRQRITNKTRLRVVVGSIDAETVTIGEEDGRGVLHSTQGVEAEDAAEHHLQEVLNASNKATNTPQKATRPSTADAATQATPATQPSAPEHAFIPTPDAQGVVSNYEELYPQRNFEMSYAILKFSETVEECRRFGLNPKSYTMDERDAAWLEQWNKQARGEGTSSSPTKRSKAKIEQEDEQLEVIDEDWYELCMGLFENFSAQHFPFLHVSQSYPEWSWFEPLFLRPYVPTLFASSLVPEGLPPTSELAVMAKGIYPHWLERKQERKGRSVIPDVNLDESDEGNVYVCFRRRELKPIRKTRRMETTSIDKMNRLKAELKSAEALCDKIIEREETKMEICAEDSQIWKFRTRMVTITAKFPDLRSADDDKWLVDKEKIKKPKISVDPLPPLRIPRGSANTPQLLDEYLDLGPPQIHPRARYEDIQNKIEQDVAKRKEKNLLGWDDVTDSPLQPSIPSAQRYFRSLNGAKKSEQIEKEATASSFRHRVGRGGRRYLDRRMSPYPNTSSSPFTSAPLPNRAPAKSTGLGAIFNFGNSSFYPAFNFRMQPWIGFPHLNTPGLPATFAADDKKSDGDDTAELVKKMEERWRFDADHEESGQRAIIDDFDFRQSQARAMLIRDKEWLYQADVSKAITDPRMNLSAPLQDALNSSSHGDQSVPANQLVTVNGVSSATAGSQSTPISRVPNGTAPGIRPPTAPAGLLQPGVPRPSPTQQQIPAHLLQQQLREKQAVLAAHAAQVQANQAQMQAAQNGTPIQTQVTSGQATPVQTPVSVSAATPAQPNGSAQSSPSQPTAPVQPSPNPSSQPLTLGNPGGVPVAQPFAPYINGTNGITSSPPKSVVNGYHQSPQPSPHAPMTGLGADAGIVRVSTPLRNKSTMPLQPGGNMPMNGFHSFNATPPNLTNSYAGLVGAGGMSAGMYHNLQNIKLINQQQMLAQYQQMHGQMQQMQGMQGQMTPLQMQQQQHFQQQQQLAQQQQMHQRLHMMQMQQQAAGMGNQLQFGDGMQPQMMNMQPMNPGLHGQNLFSSVGMAPGLNTNSNMNMSMQNINLQLGPQHMALRLPPNRAQQQQVGIPRPATAIGSEFGMVMANGASPMMQPMQMMGMGVPGNQMAAAMSIPRAPSTPLSLRSNGGNLHPGGGMMMARGQSMGPMQSPMMRPTSAASMHSNMGMPMQGGPSLPVSLHNSPANIPQTPHLRQQTVPGS